MSEAKVKVVMGQWHIDPPTHTATMNLRWLAKNDGTKILQQLWIPVDWDEHDVEWRDVPIMPEELEKAYTRAADKIRDDEDHRIGSELSTLHLGEKTDGESDN